jgi:hypothetical protein
MAKRIQEIGTAGGGTWSAQLPDEELGRLFRELREIRDKLYEAGYGDQVDALFRRMA